MRVESYKSRFAKPKSKTEIEVPYTKGMSKFSGVCELLESDGIITKEGYSYVVTIDGEALKFKEATMTDEIWSKLIRHPLIQGMEADFEEAQGEEFSNLKEIMSEEDVESEQ